MSGLVFRVQRFSAIALVPFVLAHLATILLVGTAGMTAEQLLNRTHGSLGWATFYGLFVILISLHGSIGLWHVGRLVASLPGYVRAVIAGLFGVATMVLGVRAILGLYAATPPG